MASAPHVEKNMRFFSVEQANRSLVLVQRIVEDVVREYGQLVELEELIETAEQNDRCDLLEKARQRLVKTVDTIQSCLEELDQIGVELRDFSRGIASFPSLYEGREIRLSWRCGEQSVSHWHEPDAAFACRQPISILDAPKALTSEAPR